MELDSNCGELTMPHGHYFAVLRERRRLEYVRQARRGERVVPAGLERIAQSLEEPPSAMPDGARLAVNELSRVADLAAADLDECLVAEADAEDRRRRQEP